MSKKQKNKTPEKEQQTPLTQAEETKETVAPEEDAAAETEKQLAAEKEKYLRLAAEYDNFRKRSQKEREALYTDIKAETVGKFLPVFDNLQRALAQETADEAYKKGVEMTMTGLREIMTALGVEEFGEAGESFDPAMHNAVMHCEDDSVGESTITEVFQKGIRIGEKVVRFAMVKVAN